MRALVVTVLASLATVVGCEAASTEPGTPSPDDSGLSAPAHADASAPATVPSAAIASTPVSPGVFVTDPTTGFIIDEGWETVAGNCTGCHSAKLVTQNRGDRARWTETIRWMQKTQGLWQLAPPVEETILAYLAKHYAPSANMRRQPIPSSLMPPTPEQVAKSRVASALMADPRVARAKEALAPFQQALMATLKTGLENGGASAVLACHDEAPRILATHQREGIVLGRTSTKLRNPQNAPEPWAREILDEMARLPPEALTPRAILVDDPALGLGTLAFVAPIKMGAMCLTCHGEAIAPDVNQSIRARYPDDAARGYKEGDLRGLFFVKVSAR